MQKLEQKGYLKQEVLDMLHAKNNAREIKFKYLLLDKNENVKKELKTILDADISMSAFADIKRTAKFIIEDDNNIDWLNDRIQPFIMFKIKNDWLEYSQGIFLLSTPVKKEVNGKIIRDVEAYDGLLILKQDKVDTRYTISQGTNYIIAIKNILASAGIGKINLENTDKILNIAKEWEIGTEKLKIVNELLNEINYTQMWVDELGYYTANKYVEPSTKPVDYIYQDSSLSIISNGLEEELDTFNIANKFVIVASNPENEPLTSIFINNNDNNILSTISRSRTITDFRKIDNIADQSTLDEYTKRVALEASQVFGYVDFETAIMPMHSYSDIIQVIYSSLNVNYKFLETNWNMKLKAGSKMKHRCRRMVNI